MSIKWFGAMLVFMGCGAIGFYNATIHKRELESMRKLIHTLTFIICELQYKLTPLPELSKAAAKEVSGPVRRVLDAFTQELERQVSPKVKLCMEVALACCKEMPDITRKYMRRLGDCLGKFDLKSQIEAVEALRNQCKEHLKELDANKDVRMRSYQTLGLCAGAALVIILI